jgi:pimeloyl-ACP methyl ester carboxylesterase
MLLPLHLIATTLLGLMSLAIFATGLYCIYRGFRKRRRRLYLVPGLDKTYPSNGVPTGQESAVLRTSWRAGAVMVPLIAGLALVLFSFTGRQFVQYVFPVGQDEPMPVRNGTVTTVAGSAGSNIHVETYGPNDGPTLVFTHGWGMNSTEWYYAKRDLSDRFRIIVWDLPGLGDSSKPSNGDFALETLARDLRAVVGVANGKPVILVGHSIGGMINLTFCRLFPTQLGHEVSAIVQVDTTYTDPVKTTSNSSVSQALQKPVAEPNLYGMIGLSPLVHMLNWLSYENGITYMMNARSAFAGAETRGQIDLVSRLQTEASPAVVARGTLAMFHWDATQVLPRINVPVLLLVGQQDTTTLPSASQYMRDRIPGAQLTIVSPSAHYSLLEQNQKIDSAISNFAGFHSARSR